MKINVRILIGITVIVAIATVGYRYWDSPERRIKKTLSQAETAFEAKDIEETISHFSLQYRDDMGLAYLNIKQLMKRGFDEFEGLDVRLSVDDIAIEDDEATVFTELRLIITQQGERAYLLGSQEEPLLIEFQLAKETFRWKIRAINGIRVPYLDEF